MGVLLQPINTDALELAARGLMSLTQSEYLVLRALFAGLSSAEIATETGLTKLTVQFYLKTIFKKCHCDRLSLARMAARLEQVPAVARHLAALDIMAGPSGAIRSAKLAKNAAAAEPTSELTATVRPRARSRVMDRRPFKPRRNLAQSA